MDVNAPVLLALHLMYGISQVLSKPISLMHKSSGQLAGSNLLRIRLVYADKCVFSQLAT